MTSDLLDDVFAQILREDRGRLLAALVAQLRDIDLAEEALSEAFVSAAQHWPRAMPDNPPAWLLRAARRKAIDRLRKAARHAARAPDLALLAAADQAEAEAPPAEIPDERLRLIFTCCHPALELKSRVALTLRLLGGLTTAEIARAFLDREATMGQRLSRAKARIAKAGIPFAVPGPEAWSARLDGVLRVIYLIFNEGYAASSGTALLRVDLCEEALFLARMLAQLCPDAPEVLGLLSLILTTHARRAARIGSGGELIALMAQDRSRWDLAMIAEGDAVLERALDRHAPGPFQIQAAISALSVGAESPAQTDWAQIVLLYDALMRFEPTAVTRLNRAVALAETGALSAALEESAQLAGALAQYQPFHASRAELLFRAGREADARQAYARAIDLSSTTAERDFLRSCVTRRFGETG